MLTSLCADQVITPTRGQYSLLTLPTTNNTPLTILTMLSILTIPGIITHFTRQRGADTGTKREKC